MYSHKTYPKGCHHEWIDLVGGGKQMKDTLTKSNTQKICVLAMLTALYVVLSAFLKINIIGNITIDLGYLAFAVALCEFGVYGTVVGVVGCALESLLFSAYGFSISWVIANLVIGVGCGLVFSRVENVWGRIGAIVLFCAIGLLGCKTVIECALYNIPLLVKIPKNAVAFGIDTAVMICGLVLHKFIVKALNPRVRFHKQ
jgi:uncharacterized membrane protein